MPPRNIEQSVHRLIFPASLKRSVARRATRWCVRATRKCKIDRAWGGRSRFHRATRNRCGPGVGPRGLTPFSPTLLNCKKGVLISVESSPLWRGTYSRKKPPLNHGFTHTILIHSRGGDEEMYTVETLAKNRRLYPREGKGCKTIGGNLRDRRRASRSAYVGKRQASAISGAKRFIRCWKRTGAGC